jgi:rsbT co-antagonist protein RsbR
MEQLVTTSNNKQSVERLQQENQQLREQVAAMTARLEHSERILNKLPQLVYVFDVVAQRNVSANREMAEMLGYSPEEIRAMGENMLPQVVHPDDMANVIPAHFARLAGAPDDEVVDVEYRLRDSNGNWRWVLSRDTVFARAEDGSLWQSLGVVQDITEYKKQEAAMHENQQRLQFILEGSSDGAWDWKMDTNEAMLSDRYREMLGYRPDELPDSVDSWISNIHPDDLSTVQQYLQDYLEGRSDTYVIEHRIQHKSGDWLWMLSRGKVTLHDAEGKPKRMTGTVTDITERKRQEEELRIFKTMADIAPDGFGMADADGTLIYANAAYGDLTGYGDALVGMKFLDHFSEADRATAIEALTTTAEQGDWHGLLNFQRQDGSIIPVDSKGFVTRDEEGNIIAVMGLFRDLSEQYRQEAERAALQQQIIETQRNTLRELSTPLIPISKDVMIMPLIGTIDSQRAQMVMEALLEGVARHQASLVILDITGVAVVDTQVAQAFIQAAQAVRLLGARVMLTGIQPQIAQTLVHLGVDLGGIITRGSLQSGIAAALNGGKLL